MNISEGATIEHLLVFTVTLQIEDRDLILPCPKFLSKHEKIVLIRH